MESPAPTTPLFEARGITKIFGELRANNNVDLTIEQGEIHALLGENGAGKSTLVKIMFGSLQPDGGEMFWLGEPLAVRAPAEAREAGIGMVFQHFSLFDSLTVAENIALSSPPGENISDIAERAEMLATQYGLPLDPTSLVGDLSVGERQRIEIVRCLMQDPQLVVLDEPTSVLTPQEANTLFETLFRLRDEGRSILYISHRLEEVQRICSTATIMRHGKVVDSCDPREETAGSLAAKMVGADIVDVVRPALKGEGAQILEVTGLSSFADHPFATALKDITFNVRAGEVLGIAGIAGNGQGELFARLSGEEPASGGSVKIDGSECIEHGVTERRASNAAFVPEERLGHGAVPVMRLSENMLLTHHGEDGVTGGGGLRTVAGRFVAKAAQAVVSAMDVRKSSHNPPAASLSGGNLQKFIVGRELVRKPKLLIVNQPTWGVDAGAAAHIRQSLIDLAAEGSAIVVISQDLDEIFEIASDVAVMADGHLSPVEPVANMTRERIGLLMAGQNASEVAA
jgi:simple sugar transport system ATP-binding protein